MVREKIKLSIFPYSLSVDKFVDFIGNVSHVEFLGIFLGLLVVFYGLILIIHMIFSKKSECEEDQSSLKPLLSIYRTITKRIFTVVHGITLVNGLSHFFNVGWLVTVLWYPMWIALYSIKVFTEMYLIVISFFSISRCFVFFSLAKPSVELTQDCVKAGIRFVLGILVLKDLVLYVSLIIVSEAEKFEKIGTIIDYYCGIYLFCQLLLFVAGLSQLPIMREKSKAEIPHQEKLIYSHTFAIAILKLVLIISLFVSGSFINYEIIMSIFVTSDLFLVPTVVLIFEVFCRPKQVVFPEVQMTYSNKKPMSWENSDPFSK
ncbi:Serpentine Receptor, class Z [Caenorhabditis elegans]|uniref:Serpentine Receptor, class Z n=1 Tax=Caenorhabditis elegans TaxID=6239 RepID=O17515_CAEEL|nr:Serpentine Receptor, class Z [Caenorhabditis elegans]CCD71405.2 Serpentine Receptor, class Z [Caenorhabditis elegans]|eukprot:NP_001317754.1 Uncharacterized protein CELE_ZC132.3 [Caenorhabditis elegans]